MKRKNLYGLMSLLVVSAGLFIASCAKEGPAGPAGPAGDQGPAGPSAKVFDFSLTYNAGDSIKSYNMTGASTSDIALTYYKFSDNSYMQLPYFSADGTGFYIIPYFYPATGKLEVEIPNFLTAAATINFRSVLIKGTAKVPGLDYSNYNQVKEYYHLRD